MIAIIDSIDVRYRALSLSYVAVVFIFLKRSHSVHAFILIRVFFSFCTTDSASSDTRRILHAKGRVIGCSMFFAMAFDVENVFVLRQRICPTMVEHVICYGNASKPPPLHGMQREQFACDFLLKPIVPKFDENIFSNFNMILCILYHFL